MTRRAGLTLVELLATLAIVSALTAASLRVVTGLSRSENLSERHSVIPDLEAGLADLLRGDLAHAYKVRGTREGFALRTYASLRREDLELRHVKADVSYHLRQVDGGPTLLVRIQRGPDGKEMAELVSCGVASMSLAPADDPQARLSRNWEPVPEAVRISVGPSDASLGSIELVVRKK